MFDVNGKGAQLKLAATKSKSRTTYFFPAEREATPSSRVSERWVAAPSVTQRTEVAPDSLAGLPSRTWQRKKFSFWRGFFLHRELFSVFCMMQTRSRRLVERERGLQMEDATKN
jgi:hypothetical protein